MDVRLADNEAEEIEVIKRFLPEQMSAKEVSDAVEDVITRLVPNLSKIWERLWGY